MVRNKSFSEGYCMQFRKSASICGRRWVTSVLNRTISSNLILTLLLSSFYLCFRYSYCWFCAECCMCVWENTKICLSALSLAQPWRKYCFSSIEIAGHLFSKWAFRERPCDWCSGASKRSNFWQVFPLNCLSSCFSTRACYADVTAWIALPKTLIAW